MLKVKSIYTKVHQISGSVSTHHPYFLTSKYVQKMYAKHLGFSEQCEELQNTVNLRDYDVGFFVDLGRKIYWQE